MTESLSNMVLRDARASKNVIFMAETMATKISHKG